MQSILGNVQTHVEVSFDMLVTGVVVNTAKAHRGMLEIRYDNGGVSVSAKYLDVGHKYVEGDAVLVGYIDKNVLDPCVIGIINKYTKNTVNEDRKKLDVLYAWYVEEHVIIAVTGNSLTYGYNSGAIE